MRLARLLSLVCVLGLVLATASIASAHAVMYPKQVTADSYEKFTMRVPNEKDNPTVAVRVEVPDGFMASRVQPLAGWSHELERDANGSVTAISWSGGEVKPDEFQEFVFQGKTASEAGQYAWRAWQTYSDDTVVAWTGPSDADTPASVITVVAAGTQTDAHGVTAAPVAGEATAGGAAGTVAPSGGPTTAAAYGGFGLGAVALVLALRRRGQ